MRARYYDPAMGRFISRDPIEGRLYEPQTHNAYSYSINNPINLSDPSGEDYVNIGVSTGVYGLGASCGVLISDKGVYPYGAAGASTPGGGVSVTYSASDPKPGFSLNGSLQSGTPRTLFLAFQYGIDLVTKESNTEIGVGAPGGFSVMLQQTFDKF